MSIRRRRIAEKVALNLDLFMQIFASNSRLGKYLRWISKRGV